MSVYIDLTTPQSSNTPSSTYNYMIYSDQLEYINLITKTQKASFVTETISIKLTPHSRIQEACVHLSLVHMQKPAVLIWILHMNPQ